VISAIASQIKLVEFPKSALGAIPEAAISKMSFRLAPDIGPSHDDDGDKAAPIPRDTARHSKRALN
jgi:hypothetical protein